MKCISASEAHAQTLKAFDKEYENILDMVGTRIDANVKKGFFYTTVRINDYMLQHRVFTYLTSLGYKVSYLESKDVDKFKYPAESQVMRISWEEVDNGG